MSWSSSQLDPLAGGRGEQPVATAAERLRVVGEDRVAGQRRRQLVLGGAAGEDPLSVGGGPALALDRQGQRALGQVGGRPLHRLHLQLPLDAAAGHRLPLGQRFFQPLHHRPQLELAHEVAQGAPVGLGGQRRAEVDAGLDLVDHGRQPLRDAGVLGVLDQVLLALGAGDLLDVGQHLLQRAEPLQQLGGGLLADPGHAGDVVGGVALQPDQVGDQLGRHPVALDHRLAVVDLGLGDAARGAHHPHPLADELVGVAVAGDDHHRDPLLPRLPGQRGDHVVGLVSLDPDVGVAERLDQRHQVRPLLGEQVGARRPLRLVEVVGDLPPRHPGVPGDDHPRRTVLGDDFDQHRGQPVDRVGRAPVAGPDRLRQREERPVGKRVPVDQEELAAVAHYCSSSGGIVSWGISRT